VRRTTELVSRDGSGRSLDIASPFRNLRKGESVSVEGVCLTVVQCRKRPEGTEFKTVISEETLRKTTLHALSPGSRVNLERPLSVGDRIGGHFVLGHVDGVGRIRSIRPEGASKLYTFSAPRTLAPALLSKGSIAVDGISLTILDPKRERFSASILPFTEKATTLRHKKAGSAVNLETDILVKAVLGRRVR